MGVHSAPSTLCLLLFVTGVAPVFGQTSATNEATRILEKAQAAVLGETAAYTLRMTVNRSGKSPRVVTMDGFKKGDDRGLIRYTDPPKEKGTVYLRRDENTYIYLPAAEKVARVGPKQTFGGGDLPGSWVPTKLSEPSEPKLCTPPLSIFGFGV